ncbi:TrmO family methyltransferase domain-containing protein [Micromonospora parastrephiae]|uniref:TrmO family methyltransferase domain-containing protein n=1 Tax=Micromonospora parastrephiae TaxID=2806101 RepID=UPI001EE4DDF0|nr:TrmO family methyltransferase [Micromonospora parastrephiae]
MVSFQITPRGTVRNDRTDVQHTDNWGAVRSTITIDERFGDLCLQGLEGFSHVEVLFIFDRFSERGDYREPRPYRGRSDLPPVGVFAGRGPRRPNRVGVTCCAIESVRGRELTVVGLDAGLGHPGHRPEADDEGVPPGERQAAGLGQPPDVGVLPAVSGVRAKFNAVLGRGFRDGGSVEDAVSLPSWRAPNWMS